MKGFAECSTLSGVDESSRRRKAATEFIRRVIVRIGNYSLVRTIQPNAIARPRRLLPYVLRTVAPRFPVISSTDVELVKDLQFKNICVTFVVWQELGLVAMFASQRIGIMRRSWWLDGSQGWIFYYSPVWESAGELHLWLLLCQCFRYSCFITAVLWRVIWVIAVWSLPRVSY